MPCTPRKRATPGTTGPAELHEDVRGQGGRKALGELVTCPFCTSVWVATGLAAGLIFFPKATRVARNTLAMLAGADLLQFTHAVLRNAAQLRPAGGRHGRAARV